MRVCVTSAANGTSLGSSDPLINLTLVSECSRREPAEA
jgi:hypothetical protein